MEDTRLDKLLEEVKALTPDEQWRLRELLDRFLEVLKPQSTEDEFEQKLIELGLLSEGKPLIRDFTPYQNRKPIELKGKWPSEVIIEERR